MWKFLPGVSKPESKWKVGTRESNKAYNATKRKTTFQSHWHNICTSHIQSILRMQDFACNYYKFSRWDMPPNLTANTGLDIFLQG
jgi:hypothetical protein